MGRHGACVLPRVSRTRFVSLCSTCELVRCRAVREAFQVDIKGSSRPYILCYEVASLALCGEDPTVAVPIYAKVILSIIF